MNDAIVPRPKKAQESHPPRENASSESGRARVDREASEREREADAAHAAPTLAEIARVAGVSRMTASRAINNRPGVSQQVREDILRIADEMGYVINWMAQRLSSRRSGGSNGIIGVTAQLHTPFAGEVVTAIGSAVRGVGQDLLVYSPPDSAGRPPGRVLDLLHQVADGVIAILPYQGDYLDALARARIPVVTIERRGEHDPFPWVSGDNYAGARLLMRHLMELGHRRIGFITGDNRMESARDRLRAYGDALREAGMADDPRLVAEGNYLQKGGFEGANYLLALEPRPTAIFAANDISAVGAAAAIHEAGLSVPGDISLAGFDDLPLAAQMKPGLTTVHQPLARMGRTAVKMLLERVMEPAAAPACVTVPVELVVRGSTAAPQLVR
ncbi:LacI family DNA-binding transcriptional regulator [Consotaella salsifontis]|uniref:Transcriptional regulator, LacI family n=1 Tax=Consotaella salsifontis TaxID=1365950 RepID=A0A1T4QEP6_9HYPH|nr:LacI family DNA-binding transcriptional regulator [Consotaella salsifontis]SKA02209.1 transcriptional regulator, LacI family [Consotaella salsifontis]